MYPFRQNAPKRTFIVTYSDYRKYKPYLATDFNERCGYTDCHHSWFGGRNNFHIDHFKAKSKFPNLITVYENLIYASSPVNIAKSDDNTELFLDPCLVDFNLHFKRDVYGNIYPKANSKEANYMYLKMKLYLKRYGLIWTLELLYQKWILLKDLLANLDIEDNELRKEITELKKELSDEFMEYFHYLRKEM
jgi:hypothetical protein